MKLIRKKIPIERKVNGISLNLFISIHLRFTFFCYFYFDSF